MGKIVEYLNDPVRVSALAAAVSAFCALLTFLFSRKPSRRDMVDILKVEILQVVSSAQGKDIWTKMVSISGAYEDGVSGIRVDGIASLLSRNVENKFMYTLKSWFKIKSKYEREKWLWFIPVALEELKRENYQDLLGL